MATFKKSGIIIASGASQGLDYIMIKEAATIIV
ncbi:MAG: hypothetical protein JCHSAcid_04270 [uncultured Acidilobus sp. JCHS]|nr:MAG: hypothetical protein JCHSAcid_04270 [uncultured Acidilobus sp. JCHS]